MNAKTKETILQAAIKMASRDGYRHMKRNDIAITAGVGAGTVNLYFPKGIDSLRSAVMRRAIRDGVTFIVGQGLADRNTYARKAPLELKEKAVAEMMR